MFDSLHRRHENVKGRLVQLEKSISSTLVMQDMDKPRDAFVLVRGQYDKHDRKVEHGVPAALGHCRMTRRQTAWPWPSGSSTRTTRSRRG